MQSLFTRDADGTDVFFDIQHQPYQENDKKGSENDLAIQHVESKTIENCPIQLDCEDWQQCLGQMFFNLFNLQQEKGHGDAITSVNLFILIFC